MPAVVDVSQQDSAVVRGVTEAKRRFLARCSLAKTAKEGSNDEEDIELPVPVWSSDEVVGISGVDSRAQTTPTVAASLSASQIFAISGNSLFSTTVNDGVGNDFLAYCCSSNSREHSKTSESASAKSWSKAVKVLDTSESSSCTSSDEGSVAGAELQFKTCHLDAANRCISYRVLESSLVEIGLQSFYDCKCYDDTDRTRPYFGPWTISLDKCFVETLRKEEIAWKKKRRLKTPVWSFDTQYRVKTSRNLKCLREGVKKKKVPEVLQYIMDTNTSKFRSEPPTNTRLAWFMEKQLKNTKLVNDVYEWGTDQVLKWIGDTIELPQYKACFEANGLRGRHLVMLDAEALEKIGIKQFDHVLKITTEIKKMFKTTREKNIWRDVTEPRYEPLTLHAMYNYRSATKRLPVYDFFIDNHFINRKVPHYSLFELKRPVWDLFPRNVEVEQSQMFFVQNPDGDVEVQRSREILHRW